MKAAVFVEPGKIQLQDRPIPQIGPTDALLRVTTTTICGTDVHILKGEYPVAAGKQSAGGSLGTQSTVVRRNSCAFRMQQRTSHSYLTS
jgi:threonine dehydrogenase-like Zn-dependent dehydrogenase